MRGIKFEKSHIHNFGISFGLFSGLISPWLLIIIGLLVVGFIFYLMKSASDMFEEWSFLIIISGALSNIIDRIFNGYVIYSSISITKTFFGLRLTLLIFILLLV